MEVSSELTAGVLELSYTEADWEEESYSLFVERSDPRPCPQCSRTGFYGPRAADPGVKFRACRFCGFWQEVGKKPVQMQPTQHDCQAWPECAKASYIWWAHPDEEEYECIYCQQPVVVQGRNSFAKGAVTCSPNEDLEHPWRKVPQNRSYSYYLRFWENWPTTRGRVIL